MDENAPKPTSAATVAKYRRRWCQFSLRTLLVVVTLAGCGFGWLGWKVREGRQQAAAVAAIVKLGGVVYYDIQIDSHRRVVRYAEPSAPAWVRALLGDDFFRNVDTVGLSGPIVTNSDLEHLEELKTCKDLVIRCKNVSDAGLEHLRGLTSLQSLWFDGTAVTDDGLNELKQFTQLKDFRLRGTRVTDAGMARFQHALPDCQIER